MFLKQVTESHNGIHRRTDIVRHIEEERCLGATCGLSLCLSPFQFGIEQSYLLKVILLVLVCFRKLFLVCLEFAVELFRLLH